MHTSIHTHAYIHTHIMNFEVMLFNNDTFLKHVRLILSLMRLPAGMSSIPILNSGIVELLHYFEDFILASYLAFCAHASRYIWNNGMFLTDLSYIPPQTQVEQCHFIEASSCIPNATHMYSCNIISSLFNLSYTQPCAHSNTLTSISIYITSVQTRHYFDTFTFTLHAALCTHTPSYMLYNDIISKPSY